MRDRALEAAVVIRGGSADCLRARRLEDIFTQRPML
jgi:hypothetical protein